LLTNTEVWLFTNNTTAEAAYFRGSSKSRQLHGLVLRLRLLEMRLGIIIRVIHVSGKRMIQVGVDGVSRGDLNNAGVMAGVNMLSFVPLHLSAFDRSEELLSWLLSWTGNNTVVLGESDWPRPHANRGTYVWAPAPAAAGAALEWLGESIHKRPTSVHVVVIPRLFTSTWRKQLGEKADCLLTIPLGCLVWQTDNLEPLVLAISLPLSRLPPWRFRNSPLVQGVESHVSEMWDSDFSHVGCCLRKLLSTARSFS
jgi:hypothetical protein